jgi:hypothetical protein
LLLIKRRCLLPVTNRRGDEHRLTAIANRILSISVPSLKIVPTGNVQVDPVVAVLAREIGKRLPSRRYSLYLFSSHADDSATATSDIDLFVVLRGELMEEDRTLIRALSDLLSR